MEEDLLSFTLAEIADCVDLKNDDTTLKDLVTTSEVYRLCTLALLYRCFPDLLSMRLKTSPSPASDESKQEWITQLAIHALDLLGQDAATSEHEASNSRA